ncbi:MAG: oxaloacetate decarboxylase subunit alpha, partial [Clostridia bacterium]|nr:oxaloacetate decarboxylase subunit alpha [Clostridia bacterium]
FVSYAQTLLSMGADSICIKDMAGQLKPYDAYQLIQALRAENSNMQIQLHTHATAGLASMTILKAVEVGVDIVDTAISPFSSGASLVPTEAIASAFLGTPYAPELDMAALSEATAYFADLREKYLDNGQISRSVLKVSVDTLQHQLPYGNYSTMFEKLCSMGAENLLPGVLAEISRIRDDAGYPPLVTPVSQIIGAQALQNVLDGERYKTVTEDFKNLIGGKYGRLPGTVEPMFLKTVLGDELPITHRPADLFTHAVEQYRSRVAPYAEQEEDLLTLAIFEDVAIRFFEWRKNQRYRLDSRARRYGVHPV